MVHGINGVGIFKTIDCYIGKSEATSLSEALKVNSSLTDLELGNEFIIEYDLLIIIQLNSI